MGWWNVNRIPSFLCLFLVPAAYLYYVWFGCTYPGSPVTPIPTPAPTSCSETPSYSHFTPQASVNVSTPTSTTHSYPAVLKDRAPSQKCRVPPPVPPRSPKRGGGHHFAHHMHRGGGLCSHSPYWSQYSTSPEYSTYITNYRRHSALGLVTVTNKNNSRPGSNKSIKSSKRIKNNNSNNTNNTTKTHHKEDRTNQQSQQQQQYNYYPNIPQSKLLPSNQYPDMHSNLPSSSHVNHYKPHDYMPGTTIPCDMHAGLVSLQNATVRMNQVPLASNCMQQPLSNAPPRHKLPESNNINHNYGDIYTYPLPDMLEDLSDLDDLV